MKSLTAASLVLCIFASVSRAEPWETHVIPALSSVRQPLKGAPVDGKPGGEIRLVAARGEFEPGSFVLVPSANVSNLELRATALAGPGGKVPAGNVDVKVVKYWFQAGTAWHSYFTDPARREMVPELLLNDETLVKVDFEKQQNYLRVGDQYEWISYSKEEAEEFFREKEEKFFNYLKQPVADSETLQPVTLTKGENKQFWVTVKVPKDAPEGIYRGTIDFLVEGKKAGEVKLAVRVLPFELPAPKTYYDLRNDFLVSLYGTDVLSIGATLGIDPKVTERVQLAIYKNLMEHNVMNPLTEHNIKHLDRPAEVEAVRREIELMRQAGFNLKPLLTCGVMWHNGAHERENPELFQKRMKLLADTLKDAAGHSDIYVSSWDEASRARIRTMRELVDSVNEHGMKLWVTTGQDKHFNLFGYAIDFANQAGWPTREQSAPWHAVGAKIASYAGPHSGPENPDVFRRWEGLARYKANYDGSFNYIYFTPLHHWPQLRAEWKQNLWNDFTTATFREFNFVYPTPSGVIDTIAWEGFREGIDDVRYATLLKQDAERAIQSGDYRAAHTAKKALMWLELMNAEKADLNTVRQEMIEHILKIRKSLN